MLFCLGADNHKETQNVQRPRQAPSQGFHDQTRKADLHQAAAGPTFMKANANPEKVSNTCAEKGRSCKNQNECWEQEWSHSHLRPGADQIDSSSNNLDQRGTPAVVPRCSSPLSSTLRVSCWASEPPSGMSRHSWQPKMEVTHLKMCKVFNKTAHISIPNSHLTQLSVNMFAIQSQPPNSWKDAEALDLLQRSRAEKRRCRFRVRALEKCVPSCHYSIPGLIRKSDLCFAPSTLSGGIIIMFEGVIFLKGALPLLLAKMSDSHRNTCFWFFLRWLSQLLG